MGSANARSLNANTGVNGIVALQRGAGYLARSIAAPSISSACVVVPPLRTPSANGIGTNANNTATNSNHHNTNNGNKATHNSKKREDLTSLGSDDSGMFFSEFIHFNVFSLLLLPLP